MDINELTLDTDEYGIWLITEDAEGNKAQLGHISWYAITKHIQQQLLQEKFLMVLAEMDKELL